MLNWEMELKRWCPSFKILTYYGAQKERKLKRQVRSSIWRLPPPHPQLIPLLILGPFLKCISFPPSSVTPCCSWDFLFFQPDFCPMNILACFPFVLSFLFTPTYATFSWYLRAGPSPMPSMCVSHLTSWCCRTTKPSAARTGAISFWMRLRTSRTSSHSAGSHCSTSTGRDGDGDLWEGWLCLKGGMLWRLKTWWPSSL